MPQPRYARVWPSTTWRPRATPSDRRIQTGGIVIVLGANAQRALPDAAPALALERMTNEVADG